MSKHSLATLDLDRIRSHLQELDPSLLLLVLIHLTNDFTLLDKYGNAFEKIDKARAAPTDSRDWFPRFASPVYNVDAQTTDEIRERLLHALMKSAAPLLQAPPTIFFKKMFDFCVADHVPRDEVTYFLEPMGFVTQSRTIAPTKLPPDDFHVLVIGAGMIGINAAIKLQQAGISHSIVERRHEVGGTWSIHNYPGAAVDIPGLLYAYSFEPNPSWKSHYPDREEYLAYLKGVARKYGVDERTDFETEVRSCQWDEAAQKWSVVAKHRGETKIYEANAIVVATNLMGSPFMPDVPGAEGFEGTIMHSARWDSSIDLTNKRVVVVGTGATACQVVPSIADDVRSLTVVQRQPTWMLPNELMGERTSKAVRWARETLPYYLNWSRVRAWYASGFARRDNLVDIDPEWAKSHKTVSASNEWAISRALSYLHAKLEDRPDLIAQMTPDYPIFAKYPVGDCGYLDALKKPNVALATGTVDHFEKDGIVLSTGDKVACDLVVFATGYNNDFLGLIDFVGRDGTKLSDVWKGGQDAFAYLGMMVPEFPNFFYTCGPNAVTIGGGHSFISEEEVHYIIEFLQTLIEHDLGSMEPTDIATAEHNVLLDEYLDRTVLKHGGGANGWFRSTTGRVRARSRWIRMESWRAHEAPDMSHFIQHGVGEAESATKDEAKV